MTLQPAVAQRDPERVADALLELSLPFSAPLLWAGKHTILYAAALSPSQNHALAFLGASSKGDPPLVEGNGTPLRILNSASKPPRTRDQIGPGSQNSRRKVAALLIYWYGVGKSARRYRHPNKDVLVQIHTASLLPCSDILL